MSFSAFVLFYGIVLWLVFGQKMLLGQITARRERSAFYQGLFRYRYALLSAIINLVLEVGLILYKVIIS